MSIVELKGVSFIYGRKTPYEIKALDDVSLEIEENLITGLIGHTGSGKSTLVQMLNGILRPSSGTVIVDGEDIWKKPKKIANIRYKVGMVMQYPEYQLFADTVKDDIAYGPKNTGLSAEEIEHRVKKSAEFCGIDEETLKKSPFDLSGGQKRRVALAGVMAMNPKILVLDEPAAGLDPKGRDDVIKMIYDYRNAYNATVLIVSHNMEDMAQIADKLLVLSKGELLAFDKTENIFKSKEILNKAGLNPPIVTKVMDVLRQKGIKVPDDVFTVSRAVEFLSTLRKGV
jgi:energy-coupling factor transport system ATP-binding protein